MEFESADVGEASYFSYYSSSSSSTAHSPPYRRGIPRFIVSLLLSVPCVSLCSSSLSLLSPPPLSLLSLFFSLNPWDPQE